MIYFLCGFAAGFMFLLLIYSVQTTKHRQEIASNRRYEDRLLNALRYSGCRIAYYKQWKQDHLKTISEYKNREARLLALLRAPFGKDGNQNDQ